MFENTGNYLPGQKAAHQDWSRSPEYPWNMAVCMHFPLDLAHRASSDAKYERTKILRKYLNSIDRAAFGSASYRKHGLRITRHVVFEYDAAAGYHVHMVLRILGSINSEDFACIMERLWTKLWIKHQKQMAKKRYFWVEEPHGDYAAYITKLLHTPKAEYQPDCSHRP